MGNFLILAFTLIVHYEPPPLDLSKLSHCVAVAETGNCKHGSGATHNNCHGIMKGGQPVYFNDYSESHNYFKWLWMNSHYYSHGFPTKKDAKKYTGNDDPRIWLGNVQRCYF